MLPKAHRLKRAQDITTVFKQGKGFHSPFFSVKYAPNIESGPRLAFSFGKKYLPKAVDRNRLKRFLVGEFQKVPDFFTLPFDFVFFLQSSVDVKDSKKLTDNVENFLKKVYDGYKKNP